MLITMNVVKSLMFQLQVTQSGILKKKRKIDQGANSVELEDKNALAVSFYEFRSMTFGLAHREKVASNAALTSSLEGAATQKEKV